MDCARALLYLSVCLSVATAVTPSEVEGPRDSRDSRDPRDPRDLRGSRDPRDPRDLRASRDPRDSRDPRASRDLRDPREHRDLFYRFVTNDLSEMLQENDLSVEKKASIIPRCDVGERCAMKHGPRIGRLCDCLRGAACNTFFLRCY